MKNKTISRIASLCLIFGIALTLPTLVTAKNNLGNHPPVAKKPEPPVHDKVSAVSDTSITVKGKEEHTYSIGQFTEILVNGQHSKAKDVKVGMFVMVGADSSNKATNINAHGGN